jgi:hypothetical protein
MRQLEQELPQSAVILGIDEHTACTLDLDSETCTVRGVGDVTLRQSGRELSVASGESFDLDWLRTGVLDRATPVEPVAEPATPQVEFEWPTIADPDCESPEPYIELLINVRLRLRAAQQWDLADAIRDQLAELGIILQDDETGTTWRRV